MEATVLLVILSCSGDSKRWRTGDVPWLFFLSVDRSEFVRSDLVEEAAVFFFGPDSRLSSSFYTHHTRVLSWLTAIKKGIPLRSAWGAPVCLPYFGVWSGKGNSNPVLSSLKFVSIPFWVACGLLPLVKGFLPLWIYQNITCVVRCLQDPVVCSILFSEIIPFCGRFIVAFKMDSYSYCQVYVHCFSSW